MIHRQQEAEYTAIHFGDAEAAGEIGQRLQPRVIHRAGLCDFGIVEREDALEILPSFLTAADFCTYHDHRMATFAATLGLLAEGTRVENIETTTKTLPNFADAWTNLVVG